MFFIEQPDPQHFQCSGKMVPDRLVLNAQLLGNLVVLQAVDISHPEYLPAFFRQQGNGVVDLLQQFSEQLFILPVIFGTGRLHAELVQLMGGCFLMFQPIQAGITGSGPQPATCCFHIVELFFYSPQFHEALGNDVFGLLLVVQHAISEKEKAGLIPVVQFSEGVAVTEIDAGT